MLKNRLAGFEGEMNFKSLLPLLEGLSHAEISQACLDAIKETVLSDKEKVEKEILVKMIENRKAAYISFNVI